MNPAPPGSSAPATATFLRRAAIWGALAAALHGAATAAPPASEAAGAGADAAPSSSSAAAAAASPGRSRGEIKAERDFRLLDANGDGQLSRAEVRFFPRLAAAFDAADTNGDGAVSYAEVRAFAVQYRAERERQRAAQRAGAGAGDAGDRR